MAASVTDADYERFFALLEKIVNEELPVSEKQEKMLLYIENNEDTHTNETCLEEFTSWEFDFR